MQMELRKYCVLVIITILNLTKWSQSIQCTNSSFVSYFDSLMAEYDRDVAPAQTVAVGFSFNVRHVNINEKESTARFLADIYLNWTDSRLAWCCDWSCDETRIQSQQIFLPELHVLSIGSTLGAATDLLPLHLTSTGNVTMVMRLDLYVPIALNLWNWPNDMQTFNIVFGSVSTSSNDIRLTPFPRQFNSVIKWIGTWKLVNPMTMSTYQNGQQDIATVTVSIMRVAPAHSLANGAVLVAALCSLTAAVLLPPDGRAPLCIAAAFTASIWLISCLLQLSHLSTTPLSLSLMGSVCVCAALMSVTAAVTSRVAKQSGSPPACVIRLVNAASEFCRLTPDEKTSSQAESGAWIATAKLLDRTLCFLTLLGLFIIFSIYLFCVLM